MTSTQIVLAVPTSPNLVQLADSTSLAFKLLRPWCQNQPEHTSLALRSIASQAMCYVKAIDYSITAAQHGFNIAEEALNLAELIPTSNEKEHRQYLMGMVDMVYRGQKNAQQAHDKFRTVRSTVEELIRAAREEQSPGGKAVMRSNAVDLNELEAGIEVLENFSSCVSIYINWWNVMQMSETTQKDRLNQVAIDYNSLREKAVIKKWKDLREEYVNYSQKIMALQDKYPEFTALVKASDKAELAAGAVSLNDRYSQSIFARLASIFQIYDAPAASGAVIPKRHHRFRLFAYRSTRT